MSLLAARGPARCHSEDGIVSDTLLTVEDLDVSYGPIQILFGVSMTLERGETLALLGTNGAGKSTMLRAISGLTPCGRGTISFDGRDITNASTDERVGAGIIQVAGGSAVFPSLSVRENLRVGAFTFLKDSDRVDARIEASLALFPELVKLLDQPAGTLSGGEQQMVGVAKALIPEPTLLVIDELSLGLAPLVVQRLLEVVETLKGRGTSMLVVEQSLTVAAAFADRALFLERGEVRYNGDPRALSEDTELARAVFLGSDR